MMVKEDLIKIREGEELGKESY